MWLERRRNRYHERARIAEPLLGHHRSGTALEATSEWQSDRKGSKDVRAASQAFLFESYVLRLDLVLRSFTLDGAIKDNNALLPASLRRPSLAQVLVLSNIWRPRHQ